MARICMVLNNFEPPFGGPELQAQKLAAIMTSKGHSVFIIAKGSGKALVKETIRDLKVIRLNKKGMASVELFIQLWKHKNDFDVIHVHGVGRLASVAIQFAKYFNKKVFIKVTTVGHVMKRSTSKLKEFLQKLLPFRERKIRLLQQADGIIAISGGIRKELQKLNFSPEKIYDIPNGVDVSLFHPLCSADKINLRQKLGLPSDRRIFIYTGKVTRLKGMDSLLAAWHKTEQAKVGGLLVIVGSGCGQADNLEPYLHDFIGKHRLENSIRAIGAVNNVADYLQASDVFLFPSGREGLSNSLLEAMSCGLLCIVSDIEGNNELIIPDQNGVLVPAEDIAQWCKQIETAMINLDNDLMKSAVATIRNKYELWVTADKLEKLFTPTPK